MTPCFKMKFYMSNYLRDKCSSRESEKIFSTLSELANHFGLKRNRLSAYLLPEGEA